MKTIPSTPPETALREAKAMTKPTRHYFSPGPDPMDCSECGWPHFAQASGPDTRHFTRHRKAPALSAVSEPPAPPCTCEDICPIHDVELIEHDYHVAAGSFEDGCPQCDRGKLRAAPPLREAAPLREALLKAWTEHQNDIFHEYTAMDDGDVDGPKICTPDDCLDDILNLAALSASPPDPAPPPLDESRIAALERVVRAIGRWRKGAPEDIRGAIDRLGPTGDFDEGLIKLAALNTATVLELLGPEAELGQLAALRSSTPETGQ